MNIDPDSDVPLRDSRNPHQSAFYSETPDNDISGSFGILFLLHS